MTRPDPESQQPSEWQKILLKSDSNIRDAISALNEGSLKIALLLDEEGNFKGTVSDGDIRRGLLMGLGLDSPCNSIANTDAICVSPGATKDEVQTLMINNKIQQIPVVDSVGSILGLHTWDEFVGLINHKHPFVIMAGGTGRRLLPHTTNTPKPMVLVRGKPILEHIIGRAKMCGFTNFVILVHHLSDVIMNYFGDGRNFGVSITYLREEEPLGTAGGLSLLKSSMRDSFIVTNGDVLSSINYSDLLQFHLKLNAEATMVVREHEIRHPYGVVELDAHRIVRIEEKPVIQTFVNAGIYVLSPSALDNLTTGAVAQMTELFDSVRCTGALTIAYPIHESWFDVGRPEDLELVSKQVNFLED